MLFMNLETKLVHLEDIGRQIQMNGTRRTPREMSEKIEKVTHNDIKRVTRKMIQQVPTFVVVGETKYVPKNEQFMKAFGFGRGG
jgi:processing peptidase subunit alpha